MLKLDPPTVLRLQEVGASRGVLMLLGLRKNPESPGTDDLDTLGMPTVEENNLGGCCLSVLEMET